MPKQISRFICTASGKEFDNEELAQLSERYHPRNILLLEGTRERTIQRKAVVEQKFTEFITQLKNGAGLEKIPSYITVAKNLQSPEIILVITPFYKADLTPEQSIFWESIVDILVGLGRTVERQIILSTTAVEAFIMEVTAYFSGTDKYAQKEKNSEEINNESSISSSAS